MCAAGGNVCFVWQRLRCCCLPSTLQGKFAGLGFDRPVLDLLVENVCSCAALLAMCMVIPALCIQLGTQSQGRFSTHEDVVARSPGAINSGSSRTHVSVWRAAAECSERSGPTSPRDQTSPGPGWVPQDLKVRFPQAHGQIPSGPGVRPPQVRGGSPKT